MTSMREAVSERVDSFREFHVRSKEGKYGFLVRPLTLILGWTVFIAGVIMIPLPGQGWLVTFMGIGILSLEVRWARRLLDWGVHQYDRLFAWFARQNAKTRIALIALLILIIWVTFAVGAYIAWRMGGLDFLTGPLLNFGLTR